MYLKNNIASLLIFNNGRNSSILIEIKNAMFHRYLKWQPLMSFAAQLHVESWNFWCCPLADQAAGFNAYYSLLITF